MSSALGPPSPGLPPAPRLASPPPLALIVLLLVFAGVARGYSIVQAREAERTASVAEAARAAAMRREADSLSFVGQVAEAPAAVPSVVFALDSAIHAGGIPVSHEEVHNRVSTLIIDSAVRLVRRARAAPRLLTAAGAIVEAISPLRRVDSQRLQRVRAELLEVARRVEAESARAAAQAGARLRAESVRAASLAAARLRAAAPRSLGAGATARCRDGTYSYSRSRRGTCSHHGGVAAWLR